MKGSHLNMFRWYWAYIYNDWGYVWGFWIQGRVSHNKR